VIPKISNVLFGVSTANNLVLSGAIASGRTCPLSNSVNEGPVEEVEIVAVEEVGSAAVKSIAPITAHNTKIHPFSLSDFK
jgi:hypothetical protein